jgi:hypothetical protein
MRNDPSFHGRRALVLTAAVLALASGTASCSDGTSERQAEVAEKGRTVMPFDLDRTTHTFAKEAEGGTQTVVADDPADQTQIRLVREHLTKEFNAFRRGDFSDPARIHGSGMPGVKELSAGYPRIRMTYADVPSGARIVFRTADAGMVKALHAWFDAQVGDHGKHAEHG